MGLLKGSSVGSRSLRWLRSKSPSKRLRAVQNLASVGDQAAVQGLIVALKDSERAVRFEAVRALGRLRAEDSLGALLELVADSDQWVRSEVRQALGRVDQEWPRTTEARAHLPKLIALLRLSKSKNEKKWVLEKLRMIDDPAAIEPLLEMITAPGHPRPIWRLLASLGYEPAMETRDFLKRVRDTDPSVLRALAWGWPIDSVLAKRLGMQEEEREWWIRNEAAVLLSPEMPPADARELLNLVVERTPLPQLASSTLLAVARPAGYSSELFDLAKRALTVECSRWAAEQTDSGEVGPEFWVDFSTSEGRDATLALCADPNPITDWALERIARVADETVTLKTPVGSGGSRIWIETQVTANFEERRRLAKAELARRSGGEVPPQGLERFLES